MDHFEVLNRATGREVAWQPPAVAERVVIEWLRENASFQVIKFFFHGY
jgi:phage baseplate assembly protein gpV